MPRQIVNHGRPQRVTTVVDSPHPVLVREPGAHGPRYAFPKQEVRTDLPNHPP